MQNYLKNYKDELSRRTVAKAIAGMTLGVQAALPCQFAHAASPGSQKRKVVRIFLPGGMSHMDSFDPKPQTPELMGNTKTVRTNTGDQISAYFPKIAKRMDKLLLIRSMSSSEGDHDRGQYLMKNSYPMLGTIKHPDFGAWMQKLNGVQNTSLPASIAIKSNSSAGFLGSQYDPFTVSNPSDALKGLIINDPKSEKSMKYLKLMSDLRSDFHRKYKFESVDAYRGYYNDSIKLMHSEDLKAFDLNLEPEAVRKKFDGPFGDSLLLTRRLLQANIQFISMNLGGWDSHNDLWLEENFPKKAKQLDSALAAFFDDMEEKGLFKNTIVTINTEFGRSPVISSRKGRDHHRKSYFAIMAGAGVKNGTIYGKSDDRATSVVENPVSPINFNATLAHLAGINLNKEIYSPDNRPFTVTRGGTPIKGLMA